MFSGKQKAEVINGAVLWEWFMKKLVTLPVPTISILGSCRVFRAWFNYFLMKI